MSCLSRRSFLKAGVAAGALATTGTFPFKAAAAGSTDRASEWVTLGKSNVKVTRLAFGTGTFSGQVQQSLGQEGFTRLVRYAYDRGIRFFETAESYGDSQQMLGIALKGLPRESYRLMSKVTTDDDSDPSEHLNQLLRNSQTDYFDIMLLHWQHSAAWPENTLKWQDAILEAQHRKTIVGRGASVHGLPALRQVPGDEWLDIGMIRCNQKGVDMDAENYMTDGLGNVPEVVTCIKKTLDARKGVISMKLAGEGSFNHEERQAAMRFAFRHAGVDSVTVGYKSTAEIDEAIDNVNLAFA
jgi:aryl-alcohol dehydrogenase-like predicted oxidoreductase